MRLRTQEKGGEQGRSCIVHEENRANQEADLKVNILGKPQVGTEQGHVEVRVTDNVSLVHCVLIAGTESITSTEWGIGSPDQVS